MMMITGMTGITGGDTDATVMVVALTVMVVDLTVMVVDLTVMVVDPTVVMVVRAPLL